MATFSSLTRQHLLKAIAEYDDRGRDAFVGVYGFQPSSETLVHEGKTYDALAVVGVAHRYATGRAATSEEMLGRDDIATSVLRRHGFEVKDAAGQPAASAGAGTKAKTTRRTAARPAAARTPRAAARVAPEDRPAAICPTCFTQLPGTGVCDSCA